MGEGPGRSGDAPAAPEHSLLAVHEGATPFVLRGEVSALIGRTEEAQFRIPYPHVSRRHAMLHGGTTLRIQDLGSVNGTRVRGVPLGAGETVPLSSGDVIEIGGTAVIVQRPGEALHPPSEVDRSVFDSLVSEACRGDQSQDRVFSLLRFRVLSGTEERTVVAVLAGLARQGDVLAAVEGDFELVLLGATREEAARFAEEAIAELAARGGRGRVAAASFPRDGKTLSELRGALRPFSAPCPPRDVIVADSRMGELRGLVEQYAKGRTNVLFVGETGVGKHVFAEMLHRLSPRAAKPFLRVRCGAFDEALLESELFGHEAGVFTEGGAGKRGLLEAAHGGTLFLDEIVLLPPTLQVKLLNVIEERQVRRVGSLRSTAIDVRIVSATTRDAKAEIARGAFREELFARLSATAFFVPPLRERTVEIEVLATAFLAKASEELRRSPPRLSEKALEALRGHTWPGNLRELRTLALRTALTVPGDVILPEHLLLGAPSSQGMLSPSTTLRLQALGESASEAVLKTTPGGTEATLPPPDATLKSRR
jgi:transcriptional regulator with AAA-type ATPase domain